MTSGAKGTGASTNERKEFVNTGFTRTGTDPSCHAVNTPNYSTRHGVRYLVGTNTIIMMHGTATYGTGTRTCNRYEYGELLTLLMAVEIARVVSPV